MNSTARGSEAVIIIAIPTIPIMHSITFSPLRNLNLRHLSMGRQKRFRSATDPVGQFQPAFSPNPLSSCCHLQPFGRTSQSFSLGAGYLPVFLFLSSFPPLRNTSTTLWCTCGISLPLYSRPFGPFLWVGFFKEKCLPFYREA